MKFTLTILALTHVILAALIPPIAMTYNRESNILTSNSTFNSLGVESDVSKFLHSLKYKVEESTDTFRDKLSDAKAKLVTADVFGKTESIIEVQDCDMYDPYDNSNIKYYRGAPSKRSILVAKENFRSSYPRSKDYSQVIFHHEQNNSTSNATTSTKEIFR
ncbi:hypothetical protein CLIB1423_11S04610 [[Candida] railenensis]|uniref:Uncharacterized protein n=1 Tax=[Candida] railenensis TaxID=45579 RepID=A0A9P0VYE5_9ASCO|nr:hypothetical protein CLIB1423_11S04610 [[Candida] railenensis]